MKVEPTPNPKKVKQAKERTKELISCLDELIEEKFYPSYLEVFLRQLETLRRLLEKGEEKR